MANLKFKFLVEHPTELGPSRARFTNEKHAKNFARRQKKDGIENVRLYSIDVAGNKIQEVKFR